MYLKRALRLNNRILHLNINKNKLKSRNMTIMTLQITSNSQFSGYLPLKQKMNFSTNKDLPIPIPNTEVSSIKYKFITRRAFLESIISELNENGCISLEYYNYFSINDLIFNILNCLEKVSIKEYDIFLLELIENVLKNPQNLNKEIIENIYIENNFANLEKIKLNSFEILKELVHPHVSLIVKKNEISLNSNIARLLLNLEISKFQMFFENFKTFLIFLKILNRSEYEIRIKFYIKSIKIINTEHKFNQIMYKTNEFDTFMGNMVLDFSIKENEIFFILIVNYIILNQNHIFSKEYYLDRQSYVYQLLYLASYSEFWYDLKSYHKLLNCVLECNKIGKNLIILKFLRRKETLVSNLIKEVLYERFEYLFINPETYFALAEFVKLETDVNKIEFFLKIILKHIEKPSLDIKRHKFYTKYLRQILDNESIHLVSFDTKQLTIDYLTKLSSINVDKDLKIELRFALRRFRIPLQFF